VLARRSAKSATIADGAVTPWRPRRTADLARAADQSGHRAWVELRAWAGAGTNRYESRTYLLWRR